VEPPSQGGNSPCLVLWRGTCPCWLSPKLHSDLDFSTMVASLRPLASSQSWGLHQLGKCSLFSPSGSSKHMWLGLVHASHQLLTTQTKPWGFIKSSAQNKIVHMELNLHLSFQLYHSLMGYTVGIIAAFHVMTMEALAPPPPRPYYQIPWWYLQ
jgi:hypothetical protein